MNLLVEVLVNNSSKTVDRRREKQRKEREGERKMEREKQGKKEREKLRKRASHLLYIVGINIVKKS